MEAVDQLAVKEQFAVNAAAQVDFVTQRSMANLGDAIPAGPGNVIVFSSLNWKRSGAVFVDLDKGQKIMDVLSNQPMPFEILFSGSGFNHVRFVEFMKKYLDNTLSLTYCPARSGTDNFPFSGTEGLARVSKF